MIGGGASGIFASIAAAEHANGQADVTVLEGSPHTLSKVKISGGGRCNVLHDTSKPTSDILNGYPRGSKELQGLYYKHFTPATAREWFTSRGVTLKTEGDGRMFPTTDKSQTIIDTLLNAADEAGVQIMKKQKVLSIAKSDSVTDGQEDENSTNTSGRFMVETKDSPTPLEFDAIILATGSSKAGHALAATLGHTIVDPVPSLFTLSSKPEVSEGGLFHGLSGLSVPTARLTLSVSSTPAAGNGASNPSKKKRQKKTKLQQEGPLLITHHGVSGPAALRLSAFAARPFHDLNYQTTVQIHWAPSLGTSQQIADALWKCTSLSPRKAVATICPLTLPEGGSAIPRRLWSSMVLASGMDSDTVWAEAPKKKVQALARMVAEFALQVTAKGVFKEEFVTAGGVALKEVDMKSMQSKQLPGLFFCGEVLDVDGVTGGYNFMNCWSTGHTAGTHAAAFLQNIEHEP